MRFGTLNDLRAFCLDPALPGPSEDARSAARARQATLTKPPGSLGRLEDLAVWLAGWQGRPRPELARVRVLVFAGSHGINARGVSAYPAAVTAQMVQNFQAGGAAVNQLARQAGAELSVIPLDLDRPTANFTQAPAMTEGEFLEAVDTGFTAAADVDLLCLGEMGIGNTTAAAAVCAALFGGAPEEWVGRGTGVDDAGLQRKVDAVRDGLARHGEILDDPLRAFAALGGRELAAMFGAVVGARGRRIPVLLDGFVSTAAAAALFKLRPADGLAHAWAAHRSAEAGHRRLLDALGLPPLLDLGMRLGEASGAVLAVGLLRAALACHNGMASFAEAGVSQS